MLSWCMSKPPKWAQEQLLGMVRRRIKKKYMNSSSLILAQFKSILSSAYSLYYCYEDILHLLYDNAAFERKVQTIINPAKALPAETSLSLGAALERKVQLIINSAKEIPVETSAVQNDDKLERDNADLCLPPVAGSIDNYPEISAIVNEVKIETEITSKITIESVTSVPSVQAYYRTAICILRGNPIFQLHQNNWAMKGLLQEFQLLSNELSCSSADLSPSIVHNGFSSGSCAGIGVDAEQPLQLQGEQQDIFETPVGKIFAPKLTSTARSVVGIIATGLILVMQYAQYDGGGTYCALDTNVWSGGRDADTFRGGGYGKACSSTPKSRLKRSMISGGVSERVQSRSDLAHVVWRY